MGFCLQAAPEPTPAVPVPDVAAVITVDEQALGGGPGLAHQLHLPEGSMMTDFVARFEGLSLAPATSADVQGGDASVDGDASAGGEATVGGNATVGGDATVLDQDMPDLPPPGPPVTGLPSKARPPIRRPPVAPPWRFLRSEASEDTSVMEPVRKQPRQNKQSEPVPPDHPPPGLAGDSEASAPSAPHGSDTFVSPTSKAPAPPPAAPAAPAAPVAAAAAPAAASSSAPAAASSSAEPAPEPAGPDVPLHPGTTAPRADVTADRWLSRARLEGRHLIVHHDDQSPQFDWEDPVMCLARNSLDVVIGAYDDDESMFGLHVSWTKGRDSSRLSHIACHTT